MSTKSKAYKAAAELVDKSRLYRPIEATKLAKETSSKNFDATVDVVFRLGVDPRKADQLVRGTVSLPNGTGKDVRVAVFAEGEKATAAQEAGADIVGTAELIEQINEGNIDFDVAMAIKEVKGGKISFRVDKAANLHAIIGKASFDAEKLAENYGALMDEIQRLKPSSAKGIYIKRATISTTSGPGIPVDGSVVKGYTE